MFYNEVQRKNVFSSKFHFTRIFLSKISMINYIIISNICFEFLLLKTV